MEPSQKVKILHIITRLEHGGPPIALLNLIRYLNPKRFESVIATGYTEDPSKDMIGEAGALGIPIIIVPSLVRNPHPIKDFLSLFKLIKVIRGDQYDIILCHTSKAGFIGRLAAWLSGSKVTVYIPHGTFLDGYFPWWKTKLYTYLEKIAAHFTSKIISLTKMEIKTYLKAGVGKPDLYTYMHNGVDIQAFENRKVPSFEKRKELGLAPEDYVGATVGRLVPVKGHKYLIKAIKEVEMVIPHIKLLVVGDGIERKNLETQVANLNLDRKVLFMGLRNDIAEILSCVDFFVLPSLNEGFGIVLVEAMAMRKPIIATIVGGIPEIVVDGETGILVPPSDSHTLTNAIVNLHKNQNLAEKLGINGYRRARSLFDLQAVAQKYEDLFDELMGMKRIF